MRVRRPSATIALALTLATLVHSPSHARGHRGGGRTQTSDNKPADANAAVCRSKARDYAYEKHADPGQERMAFEKCMGH